MPTATRARDPAPPAIGALVLFLLFFIFRASLELLTSPLFAGLCVVVGPRISSDVSSGFHRGEGTSLFCVVF